MLFALKFDYCAVAILGRVRVKNKRVFALIFVSFCPRASGLRDIHVMVGVDERN